MSENSGTNSGEIDSEVVNFEFEEIKMKKENLNEIIEELDLVYDMNEVGESIAHSLVTILNTSNPELFKIPVGYIDMEIDFLHHLLHNSKGYVDQLLTRVKNLYEDHQEA